MTNEKKFHVGIKALVVNKGKILLLKVDPTEHKNKKFGAYWDIPGGRLKEGNGIEETLAKELKEEIAYSGRANAELFHASISNIEIPDGGESLGVMLLVYLCRINPRTISLSSEHTEYKWATKKEAAELLSVKYQKDFIEKLVKSPVRHAGE